MSDDGGTAATTTTAGDGFPEHAPLGPQSRRLAGWEAARDARIRALTVRLLLALLRRSSDG